ncbi:MAG: cytochrome c-550 [Coleofasciculaceae cyanobacterium SM2_1_6]|nr:cytochrome c-550 [Coleofasciculaceae cyanobacterium SM2_1_6]
MLKKLILIAVTTVFFTFHIAVGSAKAIELSTELRTIPLNDQGETVVLSLEQVTEGKELFNFACAQCHVGGKTKTDPNVSLAPESLAGATPKRDNIAGLVDYMKHPTTYDGETNIAELHPSLESADIYPRMRNLTDKDLEVIAGHILLQPKILGKMWGGGKVYN